MPSADAHYASTDRRALRTAQDRQQSLPLATTGWAVMLVLAGLVVAGCNASAPSASYEQQVVQHRVEREMELRDKNSAMAPDLRRRFQGLTFFPVDSTYRVVAPLDRPARPDTVWMAETTGGQAPHLRVGTARVALPDDTTRLAVFRTQDRRRSGETPLWLPFTDATNGQQTYKGGRYVDVELVGRDSVQIDFNRAYNPTCVYNPDYVCPLPPPENQITAAVQAGEKLPEFGAQAASGS
jgi:uncharacterized protein (DUF1684 family)